MAAYRSPPRRTCSSDSSLSDWVDRLHRTSKAIYSRICPVIHCWHRRGHLDQVHPMQQERRVRVHHHFLPERVGQWCHRCNFLRKPPFRCTHSRLDYQRARLVQRAQLQLLLLIHTCSLSATRTPRRRSSPSTHCGTHCTRASAPCTTRRSRPPQRGSDGNSESNGIGTQRRRPSLRTSPRHLPRPPLLVHRLSQPTQLLRPPLRVEVVRV